MKIDIVYIKNYKNIYKLKYSISQTISRLKQCSTNFLYRSENEYFKNFYWKRKRVLWSESYFCSTIGSISENKVLEYINNQ